MRHAEQTEQTGTDSHSLRIRETTFSPNDDAAKVDEEM